MKKDWIVEWLKRTSTWNMLWVAVVLSEIFTFILSTSMTYVWYGEVVSEIVIIGFIVCFVVSLSVTILVIAMLRAYQAAEQEVEEGRRMIGLHQEREDVSRWLHDDISSDLFNIMLLTEMLQEKKVVDTEAVESLSWIGDASRNALNSIRSYLNFAEISGPALGDLVGYMRDYGQLLFRKLGITFTFTDRLDGHRVTLSPLKNFSVYLIYKETLTNIIKHAGATEVKVEVSEEGGSLILAVDDNGRGIDTEDHGKTGYGLRSIRYRAETIGGVLRFTSNPGEGTYTRIQIPPSGPAA